MMKAFSIHARINRLRFNIVVNAADRSEAISVAHRRLTLERRAPRQEVLIIGCLAIN